MCKRVEWNFYTRKCVKILNEKHIQKRNKKISFTQYTLNNN